MKLETERLIIRDMKEDDSEDLYFNLNNLNISKWLIMVDYPYTKKNADKDVKDSIKRAKKKDRRDYNFAIELKKDRKFIGEIELITDKFHKSAEIDYWLGENYWNKGYAKESLKEIINFAFKRLGLRRIEGRIFEGNIVSQKIIEKFEFIKEGVKLRAYKCKADGKIKNMMIYALLNKEDSNYE